MVRYIHGLPADGAASGLKLEFHDTDTDVLARILADTSDTRDFLKLFLRQAERHVDILATILATISVSASWNASLTKKAFDQVKPISDSVKTVL